MFDPDLLNPNAKCGKKARVTREDGRTVDVTVADRCPTCLGADIDLSPAAFDRIGVQAEGRVKVSWRFI